MRVLSYSVSNPGSQKNTPRTTGSFKKTFPESESPGPRNTLVRDRPQKSQKSFNLRSKIAPALPLCEEVIVVLGGD